MTGSDAVEVSSQPIKKHETGLRQSKKDPIPKAVGLANRLVRSPLAMAPENSPRCQRSVPPMAKK